MSRNALLVDFCDTLLRVGVDYGYGIALEGKIMTKEDGNA